MRTSDWSSDVCSSDLVRYEVEITGVDFTNGQPTVPARDKHGNIETHRPKFVLDARDRKSVVSGKSVAVRVDFGGRRFIKKKHIIPQINSHTHHERTE